MEETVLQVTFLILGGGEEQTQKKSKTIIPQNPDSIKQRCINMLSHKGQKPVILPKSIISWRVSKPESAIQGQTSLLLFLPYWTRLPGCQFIARSLGRHETQQQYICIKLWVHTDLSMPSENLYWIWGYWKDLQFHLYHSGLKERKAVGGTKN